MAFGNNYVGCGDLEHNPQANLQTTTSGSLLQPACAGIFQFSEWSLTGELLFLWSTRHDSYCAHQEQNNQLFYVDYRRDHGVSDRTLANLPRGALHDGCNRRFLCGVYLDCGDSICGDAARKKKEEAPTENIHRLHRFRRLGFKTGKTPYSTANPRLFMLNRSPAVSSV